MLQDRVSNPGPLTYESGALPIALRGPTLDIERNKRICHICNKNGLGDEFYYLFYWEYFSWSCVKLLPVWSYQLPNSVKCDQLMTSNDRIVLTKLALLIKIIITIFR